MVFSMNVFKNKKRWQDKNVKNVPRIKYVKKRFFASMAIYIYNKNEGSLCGNANRRYVYQRFRVKKFLLISKCRHFTDVQL